jgi:hypothetical protein
VPTVGYVLQLVLAGVLESEAGTPELATRSLVAAERGPSPANGSLKWPPTSSGIDPIDLRRRNLLSPDELPSDRQVIRCRRVLLPTCMPEA